LHFLSWKLLSCPKINKNDELNGGQLSKTLIAYIYRHVLINETHMPYKNEANKITI
jgi:hypothetical protein